jgi:hypothetical protein
MPKFKVQVIASRPNEYRTKTGFVQERVLTLLDDEKTPGCRMTSTFEVAIQRGTPMDKEFPDENVIGKTLEIGVAQFESFQGRNRARQFVLFPEAKKAA